MTRVIGARRDGDETKARRNQDKAANDLIVGIRSAEMTRPDQRPHSGQDLASAGTL